jgi:hypothetical protein
MRVASLVRVIIVVALVIHAAPARGQVSTDEAKDHYRKGTAAYNLGHYREAAQEYERAYEQTLDPALLFNVAQAHRLAGDQKKAAIAYRSYLRSAPRGDRRDVAEAKLKEIEAAMNHEAPSGEAGGAASAPAGVPKPAPPPPPAGPAAQPAPSPPPPASAPEPTRRPEATVLSAEPASPPSVADRPSPFYRRWPFWVGVGVVLGVAAVVVAATAGSPQNAPPQTDLGTMRF